MSEEKQAIVEDSVNAESPEPKIEENNASAPPSSADQSLEPDPSTTVDTADSKPAEPSEVAIAVETVTETPEESTESETPSDAAVDTSAAETSEESTESEDEAPSDTTEVADETALEPSDAASGDEEVAESPEEPQDAEPSTPEDIGEEPLRVGYTGEILGEVIPLSSLDAQAGTTDEEQAEAEELIKLIDSSLSKVSKDEIVTGRIISISDKDVVIDIGFKSDGVIPKSEFSGELKVGDEVEVYLERIENYHGQLVLSKERAEKVRRWEQVEDAFKNGTVLEGTIVRRIKGGMLVHLIDGLEAFLPGSQIDMRPVRDFDSYLDRKMQFKIVKINAENENVVVSHKALIERELASQRESILSTMETGQVLEGIAKNITDFGVFVDLGGVDGLLHITDLTWGRVSHPTEVVSLDEELKVVVLEYDKERQRISLGLKQLQPHPWENIEERYKPGDIVEGKVVSITDYGAFLELEQGIEGLVHVSEMSWTGHIRHPSQRVSLGQVVKVSVLSIDHDMKKISLGMKQFEVNPWEGIATRYPPGTVLRGRVRNITHFGAFVEIEQGIDGLVHVSDLSWTKTIRHPSELIKKRQELSVVVLDVDEKRQRIALGHKQIETNPWTNLATVYETGTDHQAKVVRIERNGLTVELPLEVEAFVPSNELKNKHESGFPPYQEGDELDLRVIRLDVSQKEIVMSETARQRQEQAQERQKEEHAKRAQRRSEEKAVRQHTKREQAASGPTTIGELSGLESLKAKLEEQEKASSTKASEEEASDTEASETKASEKETSAAEVPEVKASEEEASDTEASETKASEKETSAAEAPEVKASEEEASDAEAPDVKASEEEVLDVETPEVEVSKEEASGKEVSAKKAPKTKTSKAKASAKETSKAKVSTTKASDKKASKAKASGEKASAKKAPKAKASGEKASTKKAPKAKASEAKASTKKAPKAKASEKDVSDTDVSEVEASKEEA
ncbi:MAG: 30S ribosomal protein S1 [Rhodothermaceae bacterium]|nr:30S ribosomal protein S1 [Rhodothermaceae bacterium]MYG45270.1 30S ribosomal protein S1 [Rhodothermaceae bacterium]MYH12265.1 30S ribosomal protein S1 [Rhodothermaceae bacterium]